MANKVDNCTTCNKRLVETGYVRFPCPVCGRELGRCTSCRQQSNPYTCPKCGFKGA
ncbi:MAG: zinc finger domain-containing protein [Methanolobus sp.]